jgi:cation-transporting P-type ATPase 13A2
LFAIAVFFWQEYNIYASIIIIITFISIVLTCYQAIVNRKEVQKMAMYRCPVELRTDSGYVTVGSEMLVPGDVIKIPEGVMQPCDLVLVSGSAIVNEAILTGESIPVMKTSLPKVQQVYSQKSGTKHTLFGGTTVIQVRKAGDQEV